MPLSETALADLVERLVDARKTGQPKVPAQELADIDLKTAYRVQDAVARRLGPIEGWKVGAPSASATPSCSPILRGGVVQATAAPIGVPDPVGLEVEIVFRMNRAMPSAHTEPSEDDIFSNIKSAHIGLELCASRLDLGPQSPGLANLADNGMNQAFVVGPQVKNWRGIDAARQTARAVVDGKTVAETTGGHTHGDIGQLLVWLVRHVVTERNGLAAGALVAAGSWTGLHWLNAPAIVGGEFSGLGRIDVVLREADPTPRVGAPPGKQV